MLVDLRWKDRGLAPRKTEEQFWHHYILILRYFTYFLDIVQLATKKLLFFVSSRRFGGLWILIFVRSRYFFKNLPTFSGTSSIEIVGFNNTRLKLGTLFKTTHFYIGVRHVFDVVMNIKSCKA